MQRAVINLSNSGQFITQNYIKITYTHFQSTSIFETHFHFKFHRILPFWISDINWVEHISILSFCFLPFGKLIMHNVHLIGICVLKSLFCWGTFSLKCVFIIVVWLSTNSLYDNFINLTLSWCANRSLWRVNISISKQSR